MSAFGFDNARRNASYRDCILPDRIKPLTKDWQKLGKPFPIPLLSAKTENAENRVGYHVLFVRTNAANINLAGCRANEALIRRVSLLIESDYKKPQAVANPGERSNTIDANERPTQHPMLA